MRARVQQEDRPVGRVADVVEQALQVQEVEEVVVMEEVEVVVGVEVVEVAAGG